MSLFDAKFFTLLIFVVINCLILFFSKTRTTTVISLIISHLVAVLFFSLSISNYNSFKEIVLALIVYSMVILFLISNYNPIHVNALDPLKKKHSRASLLFIISNFVIVIIVFIAFFLITKNLSQISENIYNQRLAKQSEIVANPMEIKSHSVHVAVKKFYLGKKIENNLSNKAYEEIELSERKKMHLKDKLSDNFLLKRSSDVILLIVAISASLLLLSRKIIPNKE